MTNPATLHVVGTPIGNLEDITLRSLRFLNCVDVIAAEDTRKTRVLLNHFKIHKTILSYHEHNEAQRAPQLLQMLQSGRSIALVTDAGMPVISDPGQRLIQLAIRNQVPLQVAPGPSAVTLSVVMAGLGEGRFLFYGFPPHRATARKRTFRDLAPLPFTLVFFESPYRVAASLADMLDVFGPRQAVMLRELTKKFEQVLRGTLEDLHRIAASRRLKGEITIVVDGAKR